MRALASLLFSYLIQLLYHSYRFRFLNPEVKEKAQGQAPRGNCLFALWHRNALVGAYLTMDSPCACIVSASKDGDFLIQAFRGRPFVIARGSSSRGGQRAMAQMIRDMNERGIPGIHIVDGPRGPAGVPKYGIFKVAQETGAPILPLVIYPRRFYSFNSWDKFRLPRPLTTIFVRYGDPIWVKEHHGREDFIPLAQELKGALDSGEEAIVKALGP